MEFTVEADPPSVYYNYRVKVEQLEAFRRHLALPQNFELSPIRCLENESADYFLTLNVYRVSGLANGIRAEWSTYVHDADGTPRYMVVEARDHTGSIDPIDVFTFPTQVEQFVDVDGLHTTVESANKRCFRASCEQSSLDNAEQVQISPEWIEANDYIYWRNGICDRVYYDAGLANAKTRLIDVETVRITDDTEWAQFLEDKPKHIVLFEGAIGFMISPWVNI